MDVVAAAGALVLVGSACEAKAESVKKTICENGELLQRLKLKQRPS